MKGSVWPKLTVSQTEKVQLLFPAVVSPSSVWGQFCRAAHQLRSRPHRPLWSISVAQRVSLHANTFYLWTAGPVAQMLRAEPKTWPNCYYSNRVCVFSGRTDFMRLKVKIVQRDSVQSNSWKRPKKGNNSTGFLSAANLKVKNLT